MDARYKHADALPLIGHPVVLTMPSGREIVGQRIWVEDDNGAAWAWATVDPNEKTWPPSWCDGVCWGRNSYDRPSQQPRHWRYK